ncbi:MAG: hypothetical protein AAFN30_02895, partial [Actinomycetota bacterium]
ICAKAHLEEAGHGEYRDAGSRQMARHPDGWTVRGSGSWPDNEAIGSSPSYEVVETIVDSEDRAWHRSRSPVARNGMATSDEADHIDAELWTKIDLDGQLGSEAVGAVDESVFPEAATQPRSPKRPHGDDVGKEPSRHQCDKQTGQESVGRLADRQHCNQHDQAGTRNCH